MRTLPLWLSLLSIFPSSLLAAPAKPPAVFAEVYGTTLMSSEQFEERFKADLLEYARLRTAKPKPGSKQAQDQEKRLAELKGSIEKRFSEAGDFAYVSLDWAERTVEEKREVYLTMEAVENKDLAERLPFRRAPRGLVRDPAGLLSAWNEYAELGRSLVRKGDLKVERYECPAFFCQWGSATPDLKAFETRFVKEVRGYKPVLIATMKEEANPLKRVSALYLLTYLRDGPEVAELVGYGLLDPDERVREAALQVLTDFVIYHPNVPIDAQTAAAAIDYHSAQERTQGLAFVLCLADKAAYRPFLLKDALPQILRLLRVKNPSTQKMAHTVLGLLSGENHGPRDYDEWEEWAFRARNDKSAGASKKGAKASGD